MGRGVFLSQILVAGRIFCPESDLGARADAFGGATMSDPAKMEVFQQKCHTGVRKTNGELALAHILKTCLRAPTFRSHTPSDLRPISHSVRGLLGLRHHRAAQRVAGGQGVHTLERRLDHGSAGGAKGARLQQLGLRFRKRVGIGGYSLKTDWWLVLVKRPFSI